MKAKRIAALKIEAPDPGSARAAFCETLGLAEKSETSLKVGKASLRFTRTHSQPAATAVTGLTIEVEDLEGVKRRLAALGVQAEEGEDLRRRRFIVVPPSFTHGVSLKLREA